MLEMIDFEKIRLEKLAEAANKGAKAIKAFIQYYRHEKNRTIDFHQNLNRLQQAHQTVMDFLNPDRPTPGSNEIDRSYQGAFAVAHSISDDQLQPRAIAYCICHLISAVAAVAGLQDPDWATMVRETEDANTAAGLGLSHTKRWRDGQKDYVPTPGRHRR